MAYKKKFIELTKEPRISRIKLVGVELEGAYKKPPADVEWVGQQHPGAGQLGRDGSLDPLALRHPDIKYVGELPSHPMAESALPDWMRGHWPDVVGPECGLHVHISLTNDLLYMKLMDDEAYPATVVEYIRRKAEELALPKTDPIWDRLAGKCPYCQHIHAPDLQVTNTRKDWEKNRPGHRYTAINFCYNRGDLGVNRYQIGLHPQKRAVGTIECRLLSMPSDAETGIKLATEFLRVTNAFLLATGAKKEKKKTSSYAIDAPQHVDRIRVRV